jgi:hypothetical protein
VTLDVEVVAEVSGKSRFDRALALLLGSAAIIAALLAAVQLDVSKQEERSLLRSSRLAVRVFELTAATGGVAAFGGLMQRTAIATTAGGFGRVIVAFDQPGVADVQNALGAAEQAAGERLIGQIGPMAAPSPLPPDLDPHTRSLVELGVADVQAMLDAVADPSAPVEFRAVRAAGALVEELSGEVDRADRASARGTWSLLGLALLALGGVLLGLASVLRPGPGAGVALVSAAGAVAIAGLTAVVTFI